MGTLEQWEGEPLPRRRKRPRKDGPRIATVRRVLRRRYRRSKITNARLVRVYECPTVTLQEGALTEADLRPGDRLLVTSPGPGQVLLTVIPRAPEPVRLRAWEVAEPLTAGEREARRALLEREAVDGVEVPDCQAVAESVDDPDPDPAG